MEPKSNTKAYLLSNNRYIKKYKTEDPDDCKQCLNIKLYMDQAALSKDDEQDNGTSAARTILLLSLLKGHAGTALVVEYQSTRLIERCYSCFPPKELFSKDAQESPKRC